MGFMSDWKARYQKVLEEYGAAAVATWFVLFLGTWFGFWVAIRSGVQVEGVAAGAGTVGGAYLATQLTKPVRIVLTAVLTPLMVGLWHRLRGRREQAPSP